MAKKLTFSLLSLAYICSLCSPINNLNTRDHSEFNFMPSSSQQVLLQLPALQKVTQPQEQQRLQHQCTIPGSTQKVCGCGTWTWLRGIPGSAGGMVRLSFSNLNESMIV